MNGEVEGQAIRGAVDVLLDIFRNMGMSLKVVLTSLIAANIMVHFCYKCLILKLALKRGPLTKKPFNCLVLIDEMEKFIGVISFSCKHGYHTWTKGVKGSFNPPPIRKFWVNPTP